MKYPLHTVSKPVTGEEARELIKTVESGGSLSTERGLAVAKEVAAEWKARSQANGKSVRRD